MEAYQSPISVSAPAGVVVKVAEEKTGTGPAGAEGPRRRGRKRARRVDVEGDLPDRAGLYPGEREILLPHAQRLLAELLEEIEDDDGHQPG